MSSAIKRQNKLDYYERLQNPRGYSKLIRNIRYKDRITITVGTNLVGFILGKYKKNISSHKIKYQNTEGNKVIIIIENVYNKCRKIRHNIYNSHYNCVEFKKSNLLTKKAMLLEAKLNKKYKRICKYKKIKGKNTLKEENTYNFKYEKEYKLLFDYYLHPDHVLSIIGKSGSIIKLLNAKYNCNIHIHKNKNKSSITYGRKKNKYVGSGYNNLTSKYNIGATKLCVSIDKNNLTTFLEHITKILYRAQTLKRRNLSSYNPFFSFTIFICWRMVALSFIRDWLSRKLHNPHTKYGKKYILSRYYDTID